jgi:DNA primase
VSKAVDDALKAEIRSKCDLLSVVGDYVSLKKAGRIYKGLCPFHQEKTPSFTVQSDRGFFYCFGCQTGGDVFSFVSQINGFSFPEALRHLAERAGISLPEPRMGGRPRGAGSRERAEAARGAKEECYAYGREARLFFTEVLDSLEGTRCREYLASRRIENQTIERFQLGCAPHRWDGLCQHLGKRGLSLAAAERAGLVGTRQSGDHYDRFRNRLMFPIRNLAGEVIGFSGRALESGEDIPKYLNSPDTPVYDKGASLYGLHEARPAMRERGYAIVVEGNVDLLRLSQVGLGAVVAPLGTALTVGQCQLLRRFVGRIVLCHDGDRAGRAATLKAIPVALEAGLGVSVAVIPSGQDPDTFAAEHGPAAVEALIAEARPGFEHLVARVAEETAARSSLQGKVQALDRIAPVLRTISDRREVELYRKHLTVALGLSELELRRFLRASPEERRPASPEAAPEPAPPAPRPPTRELRLLSLVLHEPDAAALAGGRGLEGRVTHAGVQEAVRKLIVAGDGEQKIDVGEFIGHLTDQALQQALFELAVAPPSEDWKKDFEQLDAQLEIDALERQKRELAQQARDEAGRGDDHRALEVAVAMQTLARRIDVLRGGTRWPS